MQERERKNLTAVQKRETGNLTSQSQQALIFISAQLEPGPGHTDLNADGRGNVQTGDGKRDQCKNQYTHKGGTRGTERDTANAAKEEISNEADIRRSK